MTIAVSLLADYVNLGLQASPVSTASITPTGGSLLLAFAIDNTVTDPTVGGTLSATWTKIGTSSTPNVGVVFTIYKSENATGSGTVSFISPGNSVSGFVVQVTGDGPFTIQQSATLSNGGGGGGDSGPASVALSAGVRGTTIGFCYNTSNRTWAAGSGYTAIAGLSQGSSSNKVFAEYKLAGAATVDASFTGGIAQYGLIGLEVTEYPPGTVQPGKGFSSRGAGGGFG